jgi:hypothetical protein
MSLLSLLVSFFVIGCGNNSEDMSGTSIDKTESEETAIGFENEVTQVDIEKEKYL